MEYNKSDIVKLFNNKMVKVLNTPKSFMANGSYEVIEWVENGLGEIGKSFWVKPEDIMYQINTNLIDDINKYFEIIWDNDGLNLIPKNFSSIDIESDREDFNRIKFNYDGEDRKHKTINIHIGDAPITDTQKLTIRPKKEKKSKFEKIINVLKEKEDEI